MTAIAAVAAGTTLTTRTAVATGATLAAVATLAATTAGGIEVAWAADRGDVAAPVGLGHGRAGQWDDRGSQYHAGSRSETRHITATSQHVVRLQVSRPIRVTGHYLHNLSRSVI